jgi:hypothetical protein
MPKAKSGGAAAASARLAYLLKLARGSSHIGSTLTPESEQRAIAETLAEFCQVYGDAQVALFQQLLAEELRHRGKRDAAAAVAHFKFAGGSGRP